MIPSSELILRPDGRIYHLGLLPEEIAEKVILVGDPGRVKEVSSFFDTKEFEHQHREFVSCTGNFQGKRITCLSTGIGTDNIDIVLNELDALVNIDLQKREIKKEKRVLELVRIGTCGGLQADLAVDTFLVSAFGMGLDVLMNYYRAAQNHHELTLQEQFLLHMKDWPPHLHKPMFFEADQGLLERIGSGIRSGITATAPGFYGPQGRKLRFDPVFPGMEEKLGLLNFYHIAYPDLRICNFEMETSALYGMALLGGHRALTICAVVANRIRKEFTKDPETAMRQLIRTVLERI